MSKPHGPEVHLVQLGLDVDALKQARTAVNTRPTADVA